MEAEHVSADRGSQVDEQRRLGVSRLPPEPASVSLTELEGGVEVFGNLTARASKEPIHSDSFLPST